MRKSDRISKVSRLKLRPKGKIGEKVSWYLGMQVEYLDSEILAVADFDVAPPPADDEAARPEDPSDSLLRAFSFDRGGLAGLNQHVLQNLAAIKAEGGLRSLA